MTTVGYGDSYPITGGGMFVGAVTMVTGLLCIAVPITIVTANLSDVREQFVRKREAERRKLAHSEAARLLQAVRPSTAGNASLATGDKGPGTDTGSVNAPAATAASASEASGAAAPPLQTRGSVATVARTASASSGMAGAPVITITTEQALESLEAAHMTMLEHLATIREATQAFEDAAMLAEAAIVSWRMATKPPRQRRPTHAPHNA